MHLLLIFLMILMGSIFVITIRHMTEVDRLFLELGGVWGDQYILWRTMISLQYMDGNLDCLSVFLDPHSFTPG